MNSIAFWSAYRKSRRSLQSVDNQGILIYLDRASAGGLSTFCWSKGHLSYYFCARHAKSVPLLFVLPLSPCCGNNWKLHPLLAFLLPTLPQCSIQDIRHRPVFLGRFCVSESSRDEGVHANLFDQSSITDLILTPLSSPLEEERSGVVSWRMWRSSTDVE